MAAKTAAVAKPVVASRAAPGTQAGRIEQLAMPATAGGARRSPASCACGGGCPRCGAAALQRKARLSTPGDRFEREADEVAERVMRMAQPPAGGAATGSLAGAATASRAGAQRVSPAAAEDTAGPILREASRQGVAEIDADTAVAATARGGAPLANELRNYFEPRFGHDFSAVRVHSGADADRGARAVQARAYTIGRDLVFAAGEYAPSTDAGRRLLAHELAHVVQQGGSEKAPAAARTTAAQGATLMREAADADAEGTIGELSAEDEPTLQRVAATDGAPLVQRAPQEGEIPMSRDDEIALSLSSPGVVAPRQQPPPPVLSFFNYGNDRDQPKQEHIDALHELARFLRDEVKISLPLKVTGRASSPGPVPHNMALSQRRADAVAGLLRGAGAAVAEVAAVGELQPVARNDSVDGRNRNRAVDVGLPRPGPKPQPTPTPEPTPTPVPDPTPTPTPTPTPIPTTPDPDKSLCERYPILCSLIPIPILPFPPPWALICILVPELCALIPCLINPAMCLPPVPPGPPPKPPDDPKDPKKDPPLSVIFGAVRALNTPAAMGDRIPDDGGTLVPVVVTGLQPAMGPLVIRAAATSAAAGDVQINGGTEHTVGGSELLTISGTSQTTTSAAGFPLRLEAVLAALPVARSAPFAVAAIMENMNTRKEGVRDDPPGISLDVTMSWHSDGAAGLGLGSHIFEDAWARAEQNDEHGTPRSFLATEGEQELLQVHSFQDLRTGSTAIAVTGSGFSIKRVVEPDPQRSGCLRFVVGKSGRGGSVAGVSTGAGSGAVEAIVPLPCDKPGGGKTPGGGGGPGSTPSTSTLPTPYLGGVPPGTIPFGYVKGVSASASPGDLVVLTISFRASSTDPAKPGSRLFTSPIPCVVTAVSATTVTLRTANPVPLSLAPSGFTLAVMPASKSIDIPKAFIH